MKKIFILCGVILITFVGCNEALTLVTMEDGEKVYTNYILMYGNTVYDETVSISNYDTVVASLQNEWGDELRVIKDTAKNIMIVASYENACEFRFFDGGYEAKIFVNLDEMSNAFSNLGAW